MNNKLRKIAFFTLTKKILANKIREEIPLTEIEYLITYINNLKSKSRKYDLKEEIKACSLMSATIDKSNKNFTIITGIFKSAERHYRPPLWDSINDTERDNPKKFTEGEKEHTHFAIKITDNEVFFVLEINGKGITVNNIISYFEFFKEKYLESINKNLDKDNKKQNFTIHYKKIGKDNFWEELNKLKRARVVTVTLDKSYLGSDGLKFSNRTITLQKNVTLTLKAERNKSASEFAVDIFNIFNRQKTKDSISNIRIEGKDENNMNTILDTSFMAKIESVNVSLNSNTGEVQTLGILSLLKSYLAKL